MPCRHNLAALAQVEASQAGVETAQAAIVAPRSYVEATKAAAATEQLNLSFPASLRHRRPLRGSPRPDGQSGQRQRAANGRSRR